MAEGINIKVLPQTNTVQGNDRFLVDRNVVGTLVIPFSSVIVNQNQVTFYSDFVNLSAYAYALSASTNAGFIQVQTNISTVSTNSITNSLDISVLRTDLNYVSSNVIALSSNTTTFISGGISPSGSIIPKKVGILYFAANTKDYFLSTNTLSATDWKRILTVDY